MDEIRRGDIYIADLEPVRGSEQGGTRPVIIVQNDVGNKHSPTVIVIPITSKVEKLRKLPTHTKLHCKGLPVDSISLLEQVRTLDKSRLGNYIGKLNQRDMNKVEQALLISVGVKEKANEHTRPKDRP